MSQEKQPEEPGKKERIDAEYVDASEDIDVPEPMRPAPTARWRKFLHYLLAIVILGGIACWVVWTRERDRQREKAEKAAADTRFRDLETRYGPNALVNNIRSVVDADEALWHDGKLYGWSVVDEKGHIICANPQVEATVRLLHCETVGQENASQ
jgi:hypothetical protein